MSTTLTNGLKLPDKGSVDWYADMQNNYAILDGAVGTIAEHTTALAGKAPAVHTHTKADITDFPAYGNSAGTICEGNDSRLSDARTPVAHTHTKSDVTDLLNSNFIPSANNSYDLGSASYQWNNVYAKQYYLNSVAFGDIATHNNSEFVHNTGTETIAGTKTFSDNLFVKRNDAAKLYLIDTRADRTYDASQTVDSASRIEITDKDNDLLNRISAQFTANKRNIMKFTDYTEDSSGNQISRDLSFSLNQDGTCAFYSSQNNAINLGTSTNKWATLNGIDPGALSLPNTGSGVQMDITNWNNRTSQDGLIGTFTAPVDCIVSIQMTRVVDWGVWAITGNFRQTFRSAENNGQYLIFVTFPVVKGDSVSIYCPPIPADETPITFVTNKQRYFPCLGNV